MIAVKSRICEVFNSYSKIITNFIRSRTNIKMVFQTVLLVSAIALFGVADADSPDEWIPIALLQEIPIDFATSNLQVLTLGFWDPESNSKNVGVSFNAGSDMDTTGIKIFHNNDPVTPKEKVHSWELMGCGTLGDKKGAEGSIAEEQLSSDSKGENILTIWREDTLKLNLMINDNVVLDNYAVLDEITEGSCDDGKIFANNFGKKVTTVSFSATQSSGKAEDYLKGYRIIPRTGDEKNAGEEGEKEGEKEGEQEGEKEGEKEGREDYSRGSSCLNSLLLLSTALFIALSFS